MRIKVAALATSVAVAASTMLVGAVTSPAAADRGNSFDVNSFQVSNVRVHSGSCKDIKASARHNGSGIDSIYAYFDVFRGGSYLGQGDLSEAGRSKLSGSFFYCPSLDGLGKFKAGPIDVDYDDWDYDDYGSFTDAANDTFYVKQDARLTKFSVKKSGKKRTFKVKGTYYDTGVDSWTRYPKNTTLKLQRRSASGSGSWSTVKTFKVKSKAYGAVSTSPSKKYQYRVYNTGTSRTWSAVSRTIAK